jgi:hypothetical protein
MNRDLCASAIATIVLASLCGGSAHAEIGKATAAPGEWYWGLTGGAAATFGADRQIAQERGSFDPGTAWENVDYDDGSIWTLGLELGHTLAEPTAWLDRIEFNFDGSVTFRSGDAETTYSQVAVRDRKTGDTTSYGLGSTEGVDIDGDDTQIDLEARVGFKNVLSEDDGRLVLTSIEPFFRYQDTDGDGTMSFKTGDTDVTRDDTIEAYYIGIQAAVEMEQPVAESLDLIGRASAGVYYVDSDISAETENNGYPAKDSADAIGGRFGAALGFKIPAYAQGVTFSIVATADYYTDVATIDHTEQKESGFLSSTRAGFDDRLDLGAKVGIVVPLR